MSSVPEPSPLVSRLKDQMQTCPFFPPESGEEDPEKPERVSGQLRVTGRDACRREGLGHFPRGEIPSEAPARGIGGMELRQRGRCNIPSSAGMGGWPQQSGEMEAPALGVGAAPQCSSLHDPRDGKSPPFGMKSNPIPSCPLHGSIRNITKNP